MPRAHYFAYLQKQNGDALPGANVAIYEKGTSTPMAQPLYADPTSGATLANPLTTGSLGEYGFWLDTPQSVRLYFSGAGMTPRYEEDVQVGGIGANLLMQDTDPGSQPPGTLWLDTRPVAHSYGASDDRRLYARKADDSGWHSVGLVHQVNAGHADGVFVDPASVFISVAVAPQTPGDDIQEGTLQFQPHDFELSITPPYSRRSAWDCNAVLGWQISVPRNGYLCLKRDDKANGGAGSQVYLVWGPGDPAANAADDEVFGFGAAQGPPTGGTFTLGNGTGNSPPLAWDANAATVQTALEALPGIGAGNVLVTGDLSTSMYITFVGALGSRDVPVAAGFYIAVDNTNIIGGNYGVYELTQGKPLGYFALPGSLYMSTDTRLLYQKVGVLDTDWRLISPMFGTADPSAGAGVAGPLCAQYSRTNGAAGELWFKTGAADTAWTKVTP
jgi:hypothetical protein